MDINDIFKAFNNLKVLVIGDVMIDAYYWGKVERISPEAPVPIVAVNKKENRLGGAANVAINVQALGAQPILCSIVGNDENATLLVNLLKQQGLSSEGIIKSEQRTTTVKTRIIGNNVQMIRIDEELDDNISIDESRKLVNHIETLINKEKIDVIIFEDYDKGAITPLVIEEISRVAKEKGIPVAVDPKKRNFLNYRNITLFKPNLKELKEGIKHDFDHKSIETLSEVVKEFQQKQNIEISLVTLSELGIYVSNHASHKHIPAHIRNIADVSGAGDTVISVAALCLALKLSHEQIATLANLAGGLVCEKVGVVSIDKQLLLEEALNLYN